MEKCRQRWIKVVMSLTKSDMFVAFWTEASSKHNKSLKSVLLTESFWENKKYAINQNQVNRLDIDFAFPFEFYSIRLEKVMKYFFKLSNERVKKKNRIFENSIHKLCNHQPDWIKLIMFALPKGVSTFVIDQHRSPVPFDLWNISILLAMKVGA